MAEITEQARAKVNLALHVTGRRADGYHLLDSLVVFAGCGDRVIAEPSDELTLRVTGPQAAGVPLGSDNLVLRAARLMGGGRGAGLHLEKNLPVEAGIGGGSADAAASLRALAQLWGVALPPLSALLSLGADVPVCLASQPAHMSGIGDVLHALPPLPPFWLVLANGGEAVPTGAVFARFSGTENPALPGLPTRFNDFHALIAYLADCRNDLQPVACDLSQVVSQVLAALAAQNGCALARMSGSGGTCFGMFLGEGAARNAAAELKRANPKWWTLASPVA